MTLRRFSLDTPELTGDAVLSAANFREVCPEVLSPLSFSIVGAGMETAFRDIAAKAGILAAGDSPRFVAYVAYRPFHVMSGLDRVVCSLPVVTRGDIWEFLLGGPPPLHGEPQRLPGAWGKARRGLQMSALARENGTYAEATMAAVAAAEGRTLVALADGAHAGAGAALEAAVAAGRLAWALHSRTTTLAVATASVLRRIYAREHGEATATEMIRLAAKRGGEAAVASASAGRLHDQLDRLQGYEVADRSRRFRRWSQAKGATQWGGSAGSHGEVAAFPASTALGRVGAGVAVLLDTVLAERERSKELGLRALHAVRLLIESTALGWEPGDAALLGARELLTLPRATQERLVAERADELTEAGRLTVSPDLRERDGDLVAIRRPAASLDGEQRGTALAPGFAEGRLVREVSGDDASEIVCGERVDGNYVLAVRPAGVVSAFGSLLSHVAIVCRELEIPLVAGVHVPDHLIGAPAVVDGWSGSVSAAAVASR